MISAEDGRLGGPASSLFNGDKRTSRQRKNDQPNENCVPTMLQCINMKLSRHSEMPLFLCDLSMLCLMTERMRMAITTKNT
jgi:hypothetical protein